MVTSKHTSGPSQPLIVGVTQIVPVIATPVLFGGAVQVGIVPVPEAGSPIAVFVFVQVKIAPLGVVVNPGMDTGSLGQTSISATGSMIGVGIIVTVNVSVPLQPSSSEVTMIVPTMSKPVLFGGAIQAGIFPVPKAGNPIAVLEFDQL